MLLQENVKGKKIKLNVQLVQFFYKRFSQFKLMYPVTQKLLHCLFQEDSYHCSL